MSQTKRPNILVYISHDTGRHIGPYGSQTVHTPHADRLAGESVLFEQCYCTAPQCSPSRAGAFTGRYPHANGVLGLTHGRFGWDLSGEETHLAAHLKALGYDTCMIGTHHEMHTEVGRGFDVYDGQIHCLKQPGVLADWLDGRGEPDRPFYAQIAPFQTHRPWPTDDCPPDDSLGVTVPGYLPDNDASREDFAGLQGLVRQWDEGLGRLMQLLDDRGLAEDTLLIATTDHGIAMPRAKCTLYDPGIGVLLIVRWPGAGISGGRRQGELVSTVDLTPTLLDLLGTAPVENAHGLSFADLLTSRNAAPPRERVFAEMTFHGYYRPMRAVRTRRYKYIRNFETAYGVTVPADAQTGPAFAGNVDYIRQWGHAPHEELYDLEADPWELTNLARDPDHEATRAGLSRALAQWMRDTGDPLLAGPVASPFYAESMRQLGQ